MMCKGCGGEFPEEELKNWFGELLCDSCYEQEKDEMPFGWAVDFM